MKKFYATKVSLTLLMSLLLFTNITYSQLYINEFMASNESALPGPEGDFPDWIEIYNAGSEAVNLAGFYLLDSDAIGEALAIPDTYPDSVTVPAGGYIVFYANKNEESSVMNLNFKLSGSGEEIYFWDADQNLIENLIYGEQTDDISFGRYPDGSDNWGFMSNYTPGSSNMELDPVAIELYINEFMASNDAALPGPEGDYPDWIEIYNAGNEAVNLSGYILFDSDAIGEALVIPDTYPDSVTVPAGGYIVFYANKNEESSVMNLNFKLSGSGEEIYFWDADQNLIENLTYGEQTDDISFGRYPDGSDNWGFISNYSPGASNMELDPVQVELFINEFMASNDAAVPGPQGDNPDWIEIYNAGSEAVNLAGYYLSDDLLEAKFQIPDTYPDSVTVAAGDYIVFYANDDTAWSVLNTNFKLSGGGEQVGLWNANMSIVDSITYLEQIADTSYGRYEDGTDNWYMMSDYTPGESNTNPNPPADVQLYINEFMASNDFAFPGPQGDYPDWIEIFNAGSESVNLSGYYISDDLMEAKYQIPDTYPDSVTVDAGDFIVFYANDDSEYSVLNTNFKLSGGGEQVGLWNAEMSIVDSITYMEQIADTSFGRYEDGTDNWYMMPDYTPGLSNIYSLGINDFNAYNYAVKNYPNPFRNITNIAFELNETEYVELNVYNAQGAMVTQIAKGNFNSGKHIVKWNASNLKAGYYYYIFKSNSNIITNKALIVK